MEWTSTPLRLTRPTGSRLMVPCNLPFERLWRWCVLATLRDLRLSRSDGRVISLPNLKRLYTRRWAEACRLYDLPEDAPERPTLRIAGEALIERQWNDLCGFLVACE